MSIAQKKQTMTGVVVSNKMTKTVAVMIKKKRKQELYGKFVVRRQKLLAHDEAGICKIGDTVLIEACRPLSKNKSWMVVNVVNS